MTVPNTTPGVLTRARNSVAASVRRVTIVGAVGLAGLAVGAPARPRASPKRSTPRADTLSSATAARFCWPETTDATATA